VSRSPSVLAHDVLPLVAQVGAGGRAGHVAERPLAVRLGELVPGRAARQVPGPVRAAAATTAATNVALDPIPGPVPDPSPPPPAPFPDPDDGLADASPDPDDDDDEEESPGSAPDP